MDPNSCLKCGSATTPPDRFCTTCGTPVAQGPSSKTVVAPFVPRALALALFGLGLCYLFSGAVGHAFTKLSCNLSDGSAYDCGAGPTHYDHVGSAVLFFAAAIVAFLAPAGQRLLSTGGKVIRVQSLAIAIIAVLVVAAFVAVAMENRTKVTRSVVSQMSTLLIRANVVPRLSGSVEPLDNGGEQYVGTAPVASTNRQRVCERFVRAVETIESPTHLAPTVVNPSVVANCVDEMNKVFGPPSGVEGFYDYPEGIFVLEGSFSAAPASASHHFRATLELGGGRSSTPTARFPAGYQWVIALW